MQKLLQLVYISKATRLMTNKDLLLLLEQSRRNNASHDITGMLLYMESPFIGKFEGRFMQALEGSEADVKLVFDRIKNDDRNRGIIVLREGSLEKRQFAGWSMGFQILKASAEWPAYVDPANFFKEQSPIKSIEPAMILLRSFYGQNRL